MKLSEVGTIKSGISLNREKPIPAVKPSIIKVFKTSHCKPTDTGFPPEPDNYEVRADFSRPRHILNKGDILVAKRFTHPGCVVFNGFKEPCYVSDSVAVIRPYDQEIGQFAADYLNSDAGKSALSGASRATPYQSLRGINLSDIKGLDLPNMSIEEMRDFSSRAATQKLKKKSELNKQDIGVGASRLVADIKVFMRGARSAGLVEYVKGVEICTGKQHSIIVSQNGVHQVENLDTGGLVIFKDDYIIASQGILDADLDKFGQMAVIVNETEGVDLLASLSRKSPRPAEEKAEMSQFEI